MEANCNFTPSEILGLLTKAGELIVFDDVTGLKLLAVVLAAHHKPMPPNLKLVA